jgi:hypothetical protein
MPVSFSSFSMSASLSASIVRGAGRAAGLDLKKFRKASNAFLRLSVILRTSLLFSLQEIPFQV